MRLRIRARAGCAISIKLNGMENHHAVRVFVACTAAEWLPMKILEHSLRFNTRCEISVAPIYQYQRKIPVPRDRKNRSRTPFSFQRFLIPEICRYSGKAIYLDADMQVFCDIARVWNMPMENCQLRTVGAQGQGRLPQYSVMLLACDRLGWNIEQIVGMLDAGDISYEQLMYEMALAPQQLDDIPRSWNSLEHYEQGETCLLHFTDMQTQPWVSCDNPLGAIWVKGLRSAIDTGFILRTELDREIASGYVRPSLRYQIDESVDDPLVIAEQAAEIDARFRPPYLDLDCASNSVWKNMARTLVRKLRRAVNSP